MRPKLLNYEFKAIFSIRIFDFWKSLQNSCHPNNNHPPNYSNYGCIWNRCTNDEYIRKLLFSYQNLTYFCYIFSWWTKNVTYRRIIYKFYLHSLKKYRFLQTHHYQILWIAFPTSCILYCGPTTTFSQSWGILIINNVSAKSSQQDEWILLLFIITDILNNSWRRLL